MLTHKLYTQLHNFLMHKTASYSSNVKIKEALMLSFSQFCSYFWHFFWPYYHLFGFLHFNNLINIDVNYFDISSIFFLRNILNLMILTRMITCVAYFFMPLMLFGFKISRKRHTIEQDKMTPPLPFPQIHSWDIISCQNFYK